MAGCGDDGDTSSEDESGTGSETGDGDGDPAGDGDGDATTTGDGDGDPTTTSGDGDGDPTTTGDGDGDPTGDGDGDGDPTTTGDGDGDNCPVGSDGCACTGGGGCDPGLECTEGLCGVPPEEPPYVPCPGGSDDECGQGQVCVEGSSAGQDWNLCTSPCDNADDCGFVDGDGCGDLPGDGEFFQWCSPVIDCSFGNPCPDGMECFQGFQNNPAICMWPAN